MAKTYSVNVKAHYDPDFEGVFEEDHEGLKHAEALEIVGKAMLARPGGIIEATIERE